MHTHTQKKILKKQTNKKPWNLFSVDQRTLSMKPAEDFCLVPRTNTVAHKL